MSEDTIRRKLSKLSVIERRECAICGIPLERGRCPDDARHKRSVVVRYVPEQQLQGAVGALREIAALNASFADPEQRRKWQIEMATIARRALGEE